MNEPDEVVAWLRLSGRWERLAAELKREVAFADAARERGLSVSGAELQDGVDALRRSLGLLSAEASEAWLNARELRLEDLEAHVRRERLREALEDSLTNDELLAYADSLGDALASVRISVIESASAAASAALLASLRAGESFDALARAASTDDRSGSLGGHLGWFALRELPPAFAEALFSSSPSSSSADVALAAEHAVHGPLTHGGRWYLVRCDEGPFPARAHQLQDLRSEAVALLLDESAAEDERKDGSGSERQQAGEA